ncbi:MAG: hypothetical protein ABIO70_20915 [Pseudomonadota bacterium]
MAASPLQSMGLWRAKEAALEAGIPLLFTGLAWWASSRVLGTPTAGRPLTTIELMALLGGLAAVTGWAVSRQLFMLRRRRPIILVINALIFATLLLALMPGSARGKFTAWCVDDMAGELVGTVDLAGGTLEESACRIGGVPGNPYLPGTLFRPGWNGSLPTGQWAFLLAVGALAAIGFRDRRLFPSAIGASLYERLRLAAPVGSASALGAPKPEGGLVQACANATLWGEPCGQIFSAGKVFEPGEPCPRCNQVFQPAEHQVSFDVVSLFSADIDVLNGLERRDTVAWARGGEAGSAPRDSERWVLLGQVKLPDVLTVSQALAIVHEQLATWAGGKQPRVKEAAQLAQRRASRVSAWVWSGRVSQRLNYARPTADALLVVGPNRLKDVLPQGGAQLTLQLDVGLLPLELRTGSFKTFLGDASPRIQDSKVILWIPVSPPNLPKKQVGLWVPRIEGAALRAWLSTERLTDPDEKGVELPLPYVPFDKGIPAEGTPRFPRARSLDLVRQPIDAVRDEPVDTAVAGASISEWSWLEWEQIQLLRQQALVLVDTDRRRA